MRLRSGCVGAGAMADAKLRLAQWLSADTWCSGETIAAELNLSRTAVWKQVQSLREMGIDVHAEAGRGYRLARPLELLDSHRILAGLSERQVALLGSVELLTEVDSTNSELLRRSRDHRHGLAVFAEQQSLGRGRRGRSWYSPYAQNIYLSLGWRFEGGHGEWGLVPLVVAIATARAVQGLGAKSVAIKWPNDILLDGSKLGGCLVEMQGDISGPCTLVIGVGLNVSLQGGQARKAIDQPWVSLVERLPDVSRNRVASGLLGSLLEHLHNYSEQGFDPLRPAWAELDALAGHDITLHSTVGKLRGTACGIGEQGGLLLETAQGVQEQLAGEVSLRS